MADDRPIVVAGAGIGGLVAALSLARRGRKVVVLERAPRLGEVGAGIQLSPNASRILEGLGLGAALAGPAVEPEAIVVLSAAHGGEIVRLPLRPGIRARHGAPFLVVHRADLQAVLEEAALAEPRVSLLCGAALTGAREEGGRIVVEAGEGAAAVRLEAEALVGADGVRSVVRTEVLGGPPAAYSGRFAWRATFPTADWSGPADLVRNTGLWLGAGAHLVHYPIRSGEAVNLVAAVDEPWTGEGWDAEGDPAEIRRRFEAWPEPARRLVEAPARWRKWALCAVPDAGPWARGRVALLGDAAHAMLPFVAQGGAMAIEDAAVLARVLAEEGRPVEARLADYARLRRPRATAVAREAARNGVVYHLSGPAAAARDLGMRLLGPRRMVARMDWIWGWRDA